jgi:hypothetical protein
MSDEQIISLLQEIRDLQRQQIENSKLALANQQQAISTQRQAVRRARVLLLIVLALYFLPVFWWGLGWGLRCALRR